MIPLTNLYDDYIDRPKLTEQKKSGGGGGRNNRKKNDVEVWLDYRLAQQNSLSTESKQIYQWEHSEEK